MGYYKENAEEFIRETISIDMTDLYSRFEGDLPVGASILEIGSGAGRDLKYFKDSGYNVLGIEPVEELSTFARDFSNAEVNSTDIQSFQSTSEFDGIWACASLLHLRDEELHAAFQKIKSLCHDDTIIYTSFKLGEFSGVRNGRYFNDMTIEKLSPFISEFLLKDTWLSVDKRPAKQDRWLNIILQSN